MLHGDTVTLTEEGILVPEKALQSIGIFDGSECWGVWLDRPKRSENGSPLPNGRHLILSPIPPQSWPFLVRVKCYLEDTPGTLSRVAETLAAEPSSVNLHFSEYAVAGFEHGIWYALGECLTVSKGLIEQLTVCLKAQEEEGERNWEPHWAQAVAIGGQMLSQAEIVRLALLAANEGLAGAGADGSQFLRRRIKDKKPVVYEVLGDLCGKKTPTLDAWKQMCEGACSHLGEQGASLVSWLGKCAKEKDRFDLVTATRYITDEQLDELSNQELKEEMLNRQFPSVVEAAWMTRMAYYGICGKNLCRPLRFRYDRQRSLVENLMPEHDEFWRWGDEGWLPGKPPTLALAGFHTRDKYLRLEPIASTGEKSRVTRVVVPYRLRDGNDGTRAATQGLLRDVCSSLASHEINVIHQSHQIVDHGTHVGVGRLEFLVTDREGVRETLEDGASRLRTQMGRSHPGVEMEPWKVFDQWPYRLFLSLRFSHPRSENLVELAREAANDLGLTIDTVKNHTNPIAEEVRKQVERADGLLQILTDIAATTDAPDDLYWMHFEYYWAIEAKKPAIWMVDTSRRSVQSWKGRLAHSRRPLPRSFSVEESDATVKERIREAILELRNKILAG